MKACSLGCEWFCISLWTSMYRGASRRWWGSSVCICRRLSVRSLFSFRRIHAVQLQLIRDPGFDTLFVPSPVLFLLELFIAWSSFPSNLVETLHFNIFATLAWPVPFENVWCKFCFVLLYSSHSFPDFFLFFFVLTLKTFWRWTIWTGSL